MEPSVSPAEAGTLPPESSGGGEDEADSVGHQPYVGAIQSNLTHSAYHPGWRGYYNTHFAMLCYAMLLQSCPTLCDPIDGSLPGSPVPGILQARTLEWVAISFSDALK